MVPRASISGSDGSKLSLQPEGCPKAQNLDHSPNECLTKTTSQQLLMVGGPARNSNDAKMIVLPKPCVFIFYSTIGMSKMDQTFLGLRGIMGVGLYCAASP